MLELIGCATISDPHGGVLLKLALQIRFGCGSALVSGGQQIAMMVRSLAARWLQTASLRGSTWRWKHLEAGPVSFTLCILQSGS